MRQVWLTVLFANLLDGTPAHRPDECHVQPLPQLRKKALGALMCHFASTAQDKLLWTEGLAQSPEQRWAWKPTTEHYVVFDAEGDGVLYTGGVHGDGSLQRHFGPWAQVGWGVAMCKMVRKTSRTWPSVAPWIASYRSRRR